MNLVLIAVFGAAGALSRYGVDNLMGDWDTRFPWSTFTVNVAGSFLLGILIALTMEKMTVDDNFRLALGVGFLSSFTTFSTYTVQTIKLAEDSAWGLAFFNVFGMLAIGLAAAFAGLALGRSL